MSVSSAIIGPNRYGDGAEIPARLGESGALINGLLQGEYYEQVIRGNVYAFSTAAVGIVMAAPANTNEFCIWNMAGNQVLFVPLKVSWGTVSGAAAIAGSLLLYRQTGMSSAVGTGAPFSVFTNISPVCTYIGGQTAGIGSQAACRFSTTNTTTAAFAGSMLASLGWGTFQGRPTDALAPICMTQDLEEIVIYPGQALRICAATAMAWTAVITVYGIEVQLPLWR